MKMKSSNILLKQLAASFSGDQFDTLHRLVYYEIMDSSYLLLLVMLKCEGAQPFVCSMHPFSKFLPTASQLMPVF